MDHYSSATQLIEQLKSGAVSSAELVELFQKRYETQNEQWNAINSANFSEALAYAKANGDALKSTPFAGLPVTTKDGIHVAGLPTTGGMFAPEKCVMKKDGLLSQNIKAAGAVIIGKTNTSVANGDWQSNNPIFGRSLNPWNPEYTPGGSTGGGAASLAAGMSALEFGSDIGGSIRIPAAFCGLYGHKPSATVVPVSGHFPGGYTPNPAQHLAVQGPLARSADDLALALDVISCPEPIEAKGWQLSLPEARHQKLTDYKVGFLKLPEWVEVEQSILDAQHKLKDKLISQGCTIIELDLEKQFGDFKDYYKNYLITLQCIIGGGVSEEKRQNGAAKLMASGDEFLEAIATGLTCHASVFLKMIEVSEKYKSIWEAVYKEVDVIITPVTYTNAFKHDDSFLYSRFLTINDKPVPYYRLSFLPSLATFSGLPATVFPTGETTEQGLPIGLQAMGAYLEDKTSIGFCQLMEASFGGFSKPLLA
ncbi:MAG: hypothetical protein DRQ47_09165 [Gammaproteobacteria bacterium]|nr:MAG: hypothetical protein DRQ47_09165 [Gammaproteobacteria bacterium]